MTISEEDVKNRVESINGKFLKTFYKILTSGKKSRMITYICENGHERTVEWVNLLVKCKECCYLDKIKDRVNSINGKFLKTFFNINVSGKNDRMITYICENGHERTVVSDKLKKKCQKCYLGEFKKKVESINGKFLGVSGKKITYICENGHERTVVSDKLQTKCRKCYLGKKTIDANKIIIDKIKERGGKFIKYVTIKNRKYVNFTCKNNHELTIISHDVDHICKECYHLEIENSVKKIIEEKGGTYLSLFIKNSIRYVKFTCKKNHETTKSASELKTGSWCQRCNESKYESAVRAIFKDIFKKEFLPKFPKWLINPKSKRLLELDGYEPELNLAFEYNGQQHYEFVKMYHKTQNKLKERRYKDTVKFLSCLNKDVKLIVIPYYVKYDDLQTFIINKLIYNKVILKEPNKTNFSDLKIDNKHDLVIREINDFAKLYDKKIITDLNTIVSKKSKIEVLCKNDHPWSGQVVSLFNNCCHSCKIYDKIIKAMLETYGEDSRLITASKDIIGSSSKIVIEHKNKKWEGTYIKLMSKLRHRKVN